MAKENFMKEECFMMFQNVLLLSSWHLLPQCWSESVPPGPVSVKAVNSVVSTEGSIRSHTGLKFISAKCFLHSRGKGVKVVHSRASELNRFKNRVGIFLQRFKTCYHIHLILDYWGY